MFDLDKNLNSAAWYIAAVASTAPAAATGVALFQTAERESWAMTAFAFALGASLACFTLRFWHWITQRFNWDSLTTYCLVGGAAGLVVAIISSKLGLLAGAAIVGGIQAAAISWYIRRPDLDEPNPPTSPQ